MPFLPFARKTAPVSPLMRPAAAPKKPAIDIPKAALLFGGALLMACAIVIGLLWTQLREAKRAAVAPVTDETAALLAEVGALIRLPPDETPTVATVSDPEKLRDQAFFKDASEGDKVLIYTGSKKAILYSPSEKRIVEVANVNLSQGTGGAPATP
jgi:hypothetical protein